MTRATKETTWLTGEKVRLWELKLRLSTVNTPLHFCYKYSIRNERNDTYVWEREPSRVVHIKEPSEYKGELGEAGSTKWRNVNDVFLVNGYINKSDANFVGGLSFDKIADLGIFIGPYPQIEEDVITMAKAGVTGVFNV